MEEAKVELFWGTENRITYVSKSEIREFHVFPLTLAGVEAL